MNTSRCAWLLGLGVLAACSSRVEQSRPPAAPVAASGPQAQGFETEWRRAVANSAPGSTAKAWEQEVNPTVERAYGTAFDSCVPQHDTADPADASRRRFVLDIAQDGSVRQVWSESESAMDACVRASLSQTKFAFAPYDGYRLGLVLDLDDTLDQSETLDLSELPRLPRPSPGQITSDDATRTAFRDMETTEGRTYMKSVVPGFLEVFKSHLDKCMTIPLLESELSLRGYGLIVEVAEDGATQRVLVVPDPATPQAGPFQSPRADCLRNGLSQTALPAPPWDGFWLLLGLDNPPRGPPAR